MSLPGRLVHLIGTQPNFMKVAPLLSAFDDAGFEDVLVHSSQHSDAEMSDTIFAQLGLSELDHNLGVESDTHIGADGRRDDGSGVGA